MEDKVYVIVRHYDNIDTDVLCFKDKEKAKDYAIEMADHDHEYYKFERDFENCCDEIENEIYFNNSILIWVYECEEITIKLLETIIR